MMDEPKNPLLLRDGVPPAVAVDAEGRLLLHDREARKEIADLWDAVRDLQARLDTAGGESEEK